MEELKESQEERRFPFGMTGKVVQKKEELGTWPLGVSQPSPVIFCWDSSLTFKAALWQNSRTNKGLHF